jgi:cytochrome c oxidase subunit 2
MVNLPFLATAAATELAKRVDLLFLGLVAISAFYLALIFLPMLYFLIKYRRGRPANRDPIRIKTWKVEIVWTVIPFLMMMGLFGWGAQLYYQVERAPDHALEAVVVGKQWMWKIQHEEGNREINELHVPLGETFKLTMTSQDVIHSFSIPAFRIKQDVVPGRYVTEWFKPTRVGSFHLFCAEYCGSDHSVMGGRIIVMKPADYQAWLKNNHPSASIAIAGANLFRSLGCSGCHMGNPSVHAPRLEGLYGKPVPLNGGQVVVADDQYIRDSILLPASQIAAGYTNLMPSFRGHVSEEELMELIAYIKSIGNENPTEAPK